MTPKQAEQQIKQILSDVGAVTQMEYIKLTGYDKCRQNLNNDMKKEKIAHVKVLGRRYPIIHQ